jgi:RNA-directed DNA polymerase
MERYTLLRPYEKPKRRRKGLANFAYVRYCDDFVVLCNGTKEQAIAMKQELAEFLQTELKLTLSMEKTKVTHLDDGFTFLGFHIQRCRGAKGMTTKILISKSAYLNCLDKLQSALSASRQQDSVVSKIQGVNRIISGWCRYYQYTSRASTTFGKLEYQTFWLMAHWLGHKFKLTMPEVLRRYKRGDSFTFHGTRLIRANEFKTKTYTKRKRSGTP